jgi:hypothetical protein
VNQFDKIVIRLEGDWPDWQCWIVHRVVGGPLWCARRWADTGPVLNEDSPDELVGAIGLAQQDDD